MSSGFLLPLMYILCAFQRAKLFISGEEFKAKNSVNLVEIYSRCLGLERMYVLFLHVKGAGW